MNLRKVCSDPFPLLLPGELKSRMLQSLPGLADKRTRHFGWFLEMHFKLSWDLFRKKQAETVDKVDLASNREMFGSRGTFFVLPLTEKHINIFIL